MNLRVKGFKGFVLGFITCAMLTGSVAYAATGTQIEVYFSSLKYMFDGVEKKPTEGQGFIYNGTTYVPLRFIGESVGKDVNWDGDTQTIWVGKKQGSFKYLSDIEYARFSGSETTNLTFNQTNNRKLLKIAGNTYQNGISFNVSQKVPTLDYNLNGNYSRLTGIIGVDDETKNSGNTGILKIIGDGKELYSNNNLIGGNNPLNLDINVSGVLKLQIVVQTDRKVYDETYVDLAELKVLN
jgi:hypothetical protein